MKTPEQVIEEAIEEALHRMNEQDRVWNSEIVEIAKEHAQELPGPISSPSDLIVEVDGERTGTLLGIDSIKVESIPPDEEIPYQPGEDPSERFELADHHIRLLHPQGGVVLDNKMENR